MAESSIDTSILNTILPLKEMSELGAERARISGADKPLGEDLKMLEDGARAQARALFTDDYDPVQHRHHKVREEQFQKDLAEIDDAKIADGYAAAYVTEREEELARKQSGRQKPEMPQIIFIAAIIAFALSVAPTLHDRFFLTLEDEILAWAASLAGASVIGALVTWALLGSVAATGKRSAGNLIGLIAGIGVGVGFGLLRVSDAESFDEYVFAGALTVIEISTVLFLDWLAADFRREYVEWAAHQEEISILTARLNMAKEQRSRRVARVRELEEKIQEHMHFVETLQVRHSKIRELEDLAVNVTLDAYHKGVRANKGRLLGIHTVLSKG